MPEWRYACPYGHRNIRLGRDRVKCDTCRKYSDRHTYPKDDMVDLANGEVPPHA